MLGANRAGASSVRVMRRRSVVMSVLAVTLLVGVVSGAGKAAVLNLLAPADLRGNPAGFVATFSPSSAISAALPGPLRRATPWPTWGLTPQRTRYAGLRLRPPFKVVWTVHAGAMIELPPALGYGRLFFGTHAGTFIASSAKTGLIAWQRQLRHCMAAAPELAGGVAYVALMGRAPCRPHQEGDRGGVIALDAKTGRSLWMFHTGVVESSPLLVGGLLYFASYTSRSSSSILAIDVRTHRVRWSFRVPSKIAGSLALLDGVVYVGSYGARVYALDAITGAPHWVARMDTGLFAALSTTGFYATPAIAYGRVYLGGFDGREYALDARSGLVLWARRLGGRIYSSAAVYRRTVYVGSFDKHVFHALDAATGDTRWTFRADGPVVGSPTVLGGLVYFSTLAHTTYALDARTGRLVWTFADGEYSPIVADTHRLYLVGLGRIYGLVPVKSRTALPS